MEIVMIVRKDTVEAFELLAKENTEIMNVCVVGIKVPDLTGKTLRAVAFDRCDFSETVFRNCTLDGVHFDGWQGVFNLILINCIVWAGTIYGIDMGKYEETAFNTLLDAVDRGQKTPHPSLGEHHKLRPLLNGLQVDHWIAKAANAKGAQ
jgi:hypothetical protein